MNFNFNFISLLCSFPELNQRNQGDRIRAGAFSSPFILLDSLLDATGSCSWELLGDGASLGCPLVAGSGSAAPPSTPDRRPPCHYSYSC